MHERGSMPAAWSGAGVAHIVSVYRCRGEGLAACRVQRLDRSRAGGLRRTITESSRVMTCRSLGPGSGCGVGLPYCLVACGCAMGCALTARLCTCGRACACVWLCAVGIPMYGYAEMRATALSYISRTYMPINAATAPEVSHARGDNVVGGAGSGLGKNTRQDRELRGHRLQPAGPRRTAQLVAENTQKKRAILNLFKN
jgi:hypothetical protein